MVLFNASPRGLFPHALLAAELGGQYGTFAAVSGADGRHYPVHLLADRHHDWHTRRGRADDRRRRPVLGRLVENALRELPAEVTAVGVVCGGSRWQIIASAQLSEAMPALVAAVTLNPVSMIEYSAIAGTIGAGGIGYRRGVRLSALRQPHHDRDDRCPDRHDPVDSILGDRLVNRLRHTQGNLV